ncbi:type II toxin-antitoxin system RelE/ParE family toxin [Burkholderia ambifaria]|uniref:type II toxin-antitoxin system RelE/ParE family toxin n=1 Tax=Burkholderia ambifaria TaxID=152480 RepID=UPI001FC8C3D9|nr:type II toxin-antitoxin system RelE/ParE family toxin [Burkholderia ambifaria]
MADAAGEADLEDIWAHTFERWSLEQAEHYVGEFASASSVSRGASGEGDRVVRATAIGATWSAPTWCSIAKRPESLDLIRVLHQRMDVDRHL